MCCSSINPALLRSEFWKRGLEDSGADIDLAFIVTAVNPGLSLEEAYGQEGAAEPRRMTGWHSAAEVWNEDIQMVEDFLFLPTNIPDLLELFLNTLGFLVLET